MTSLPYHTSVIIGAGTCLSASLARLLADAGCKVGLAARSIGELRTASPIGGRQDFPPGTVSVASRAP